MAGPDQVLLKRYDAEVMDFITSDPGTAGDTRFNELALRGFELQYQQDGDYRQQCARIGRTPDRVGHWQEIPAAASFAFHAVVGKAFSGAEAAALAAKSGVVELRRKRGRVFPDSDVRAVTESANRRLGKAWVFPDTDSMKMLFLVPSPVMAPGMVMASGLEALRRRFGTNDSGFLISFRGLDLRKLVTALRLSERTGRPLALLGSTWAFDHFFDACRAEGVRFRLPAGSRIVESGGYVGRYARCSPDELIGKCRDILGVREEYCINALWLCESSTVYFDNVLRDSFAGVRRPRTKQSPPWCRTIVIDPFSMKRLPKGRTGLLRHYDLTNRAMAIAVQTGNLGYETEEGFEVVGKWNGNVKNPAIDALPGHPGGRILSSLMDSFLRRKFSSIGRIYSSLA